MSVRIGIVAGFALFLALAPLAAAEEPTGFREWAWGTTKATIINAASWCQEPNPSRGADDDLLPALSGRRGRHPGHPGLPPRTRAAGSARPLHRAAVLRELLPRRLPDVVAPPGTPGLPPRARAAGSARPLHRAAVLRELLPSRLPDGVCRTGTPPDAP